MYGSEAFREQCELTIFGKERVYNVKGTSVDKRGAPWIGFWKWFISEAGKGGCTPYCDIAVQYKTDHSGGTVGGHMEKEDYDGWWYILPICHGHNAPNGRYNRGGWGGSLITEETACAVRIPPYRGITPNTVYSYRTDPRISVDSYVKSMNQPYI